MSETPAVGTRLGRYQLEARLGQGAAGVVYRAADTLLGVQVALKVFPKAPTSGTADGEDAAVARLRRELLLSRRVQHPGVCRVHDLHEDGGHRFFAMDLVEGETLQWVLEREGRLAPGRAATIARGVAEAIAAAHAAGVVHRDLKPGNIMLAAGERPVVLDFGIATAPDVTALTSPGAVVGTLRYIAPEVWLGEAASARSDVYALGVLLYRMITGRVPFEGNILDALLKSAPVPPGMHVPGLPAELEALILEAIAVRPEDRVPSAAALAEALEPWATPAPAEEEDQAPAGGARHVPLGDREARGPAPTTAALLLLDETEDRPLAPRAPPETAASPAGALVETEPPFLVAERPGRAPPRALVGVGAALVVVAVGIAAAQIAGLDASARGRELAVDARPSPPSSAPPPEAEAPVSEAKEPALEEKEPAPPPPPEPAPLVVVVEAPRPEEATATPTAPTGPTAPQRASPPPRATRLKEARRELLAALRAKGLLEGDLPALDEARERAARLQRERRLDEALGEILRARALADEVVVDEAFLHRKLLRLNRGLEARPERREEIEALQGALFDSLARRDYEEANRALNRCFWRLDDGG